MCCRASLARYGATARPGQAALSVREPRDAVIVIEGEYQPM